MSVAAAHVQAAYPRRFFQAVAGLLLVLVLVAFTPTFYFRERFGAEAYPAYLGVHGALLTLWFVVLFVQATFIAERRVRLHRKFGVFATVVGILVVPAGLSAALGFSPRLLALEGELPAVVERLGLVVWGNVGMLVAFSLLLAAALILKRDRGWHPRLMLLAGVSLTGPAFARIARFDSLDGVSEAPLIAFGTALLVGALLACDVANRGRPHAASVLGSAVMIGFTGLGAAFGGSETGRGLVLALAGRVPIW